MMVDRRGVFLKKRKMAFVMRTVNSHWPAGDVYLWSPAPASVVSGYHKIWGVVKRKAPTATSWGRDKTDGIGEKIRSKLSP